MLRQPAMRAPHNAMSTAVSYQDVRSPGGTPNTGTAGDGAGGVAARPLPPQLLAKMNRGDMSGMQYTDATAPRGDNNGQQTPGTEQTDVMKPESDGGAGGVAAQPLPANLLAQINRGDMSGLQSVNVTKPGVSGNDAE